MPKQLARREAEIIPIDRDETRKQELREEFFNYSLEEGKEYRKELSKLNREIATLEEELEILESAIAKDMATLSANDNQNFELTHKEFRSIENAITDLHIALRPLRERRYSLETKITPDSQELMRIRTEVREDKRKRAKE